MKKSITNVSFAFRVLATLTAVFTFFLIVIGALVRVSGSGLGCPDWPLCHGQIFPPLELHPIVEYSHRLTTTLVTLFVLSTAIWAWAKYRNHKWIFRGSLLAVVLLVVQIGIGGITVLAELPPTVVAFHLGNAMLLFATTLIVATAAWRFPNVSVPEKREPGWIFGSSLSKLIVASALGVFVIIISGSLVEGSGAAGACTTWPICNPGEVVSAGPLAVIHMLHRFIVGVAGLLALYTFYRVVRLQSQNHSAFVVAMLGALLLILQVFVGAAQVLLQFPPLVEGAHVALASAVWGSLVVLLLLVGPGQIVSGNEIDVPTGGRPILVGPRVADYIALTKPWIVALLLTTTVAGMLVAARGLPPVNVLLLTLVGGAFAAGGANALNSYIDRDVDKIMGRTSRRPLPSGRVSARSALLFSLCLSVLSPLILGFGVNWLAAGLAVLGIVYYAGLYTIILKRATPQNIVIGGAAGAIPPLVGWAAVSDNVGLLGLYLFAIILLWTPPHTWALMLLLDKDYHRAKIPMLPAAWGHVEARRQIILYSILLFVTTLVPFSIGALGLVYFSGAVALGGYFLVLALRLWRNGEGYKPFAKRLYHFSNAYLALLFLAMVIDHWLPTWRV